MAVAPGLYEIAFGFYSKKNGSVKVYINGEEVIIASQLKPHYANYKGKEN